MNISEKRRLVGAVIRVGSDSKRNNTVCGTISKDQVMANLKVEVTCDLYGRYLSVDIPGEATLTLCEVQAFTGRCHGKIQCKGHGYLHNVLRNFVKTL